MKVCLGYIPGTFSLIDLGVVSDGIVCCGVQGGSSSGGGKHMKTVTVFSVEIVGYHNLRLKAANHVRQGFGG